LLIPSRTYSLRPSSIPSYHDESGELLGGGGPDVGFLERVDQDPIPPYPYSLELDILGKKVKHPKKYNRNETVLF